MTVIELLLRLIGRIPFLKTYANFKLRKSLSSQKNFSDINKWYLNRSFREKGFFFNLFSKAYSKGNYSPIKQNWQISFGSKKILMPLSSANIRLDWGLACSILGNDIEVKQTYEYLILSKRVKCFIDIGANYGTHSLLFLINDIKTISFEPNVLCFGKFKELCDLNNVIGTAEPFALGDIETEADLTFSESDTWNGRISYEKDKSDKKLNKSTVKVKKLDNYIKENHLVPDLIKIDTEGFELNVLNGAKESLIENNPPVIFECLGKNEKKGLYSFFDSINYQIYQLPYYFDPSQKPLSLDEFTGIDTETNFIAVLSQK